MSLRAPLQFAELEIELKPRRVNLAEQLNRLIWGVITGPFRQKAEQRVRSGDLSKLVPIFKQRYYPYVVKNPDGTPRIGGTLRQSFHITPVQTPVMGMIGTWETPYIGHLIEKVEGGQARLRTPFTTIKFRQKILKALRLMIFNHLKSALRRNKWSYKTISTTGRVTDPFEA